MSNLLVKTTNTQIATATSFNNALMSLTSKDFKNESDVLHAFGTLNAFDKYVENTRVWLLGQYIKLSGKKRPEVVTFCESNFGWKKASVYEKIKVYETFMSPDTPRTKWANTDENGNIHDFSYTAMCYILRLKLSVDDIDNAIKSGVITVDASVMDIKKLAGDLLGNGEEVEEKTAEKTEEEAEEKTGKVTYILKYATDGNEVLKAAKDEKEYTFEEISDGKAVRRHDDFIDVINYAINDKGVVTFSLLRYSAK